MIDLSISFLVAVIAALMAILLLFTLYLIIQRERENIFKHKQKIYLEQFTRLWHDYLFDKRPLPLELVPQNRADVEAIEIIFSSYLKNISSSEIRQKIKEFSNLYLKQFYKQDLTSKRWGIRMNALYRIADFGIDELFESCRSFEKKSNSREEYFQLLKIYSLFEPDLFIEKLGQLQDHYSESEYRRLLVLLEEDVFIRFFEDFKSWSANIQYALIDTAAVRRNAQYVNKLKQFLADGDSEIRIRALKGIYEIGIIDEIDIYVPFVTSPVWEERLMVSKIFKHSSLANTYTYLEKLLQDENWWVRSQTAATIADDRQGSAKLKQFIQEAEDEYAVEMAKETLTRKQESR